MTSITDESAVAINGSGDDTGRQPDVIVGSANRSSMATLAAEAFNELEKENAQLKNKLAQAMIALEERNTAIEQLNLAALAQRNNYSSDVESLRERCREVQQERDAAVEQAARHKVLFQSFFVMMSEFSSQPQQPAFLLSDAEKSGKKPGRKKEEGLGGVAHSSA